MATMTTRQQQRSEDNFCFLTRASRELAGRFRTRAQALRHLEEEGRKSSTDLPSVPSRVRRALWTAPAGDAKSFVSVLASWASESRGASQLLAQAHARAFADSGASGTVPTRRNQKRARPTTTAQTRRQKPRRAATPTGNAAAPPLPWWAGASNVDASDGTDSIFLTELSELPIFRQVRLALSADHSSATAAQQQRQSHQRRSGGCGSFHAYDVADVAKFLVEPLARLRASLWLRVVRPSWPREEEEERRGEGAGDGIVETEEDDDGSPLLPTRPQRVRLVMSSSPHSAARAAGGHYWPVPGAADSRDDAGQEADCGCEWCSDPMPVESLCGPCREPLTCAMVRRVLGAGFDAAGIDREAFMRFRRFVQNGVMGPSLDSSDARGFRRRSELHAYWSWNSQLLQAKALQTAVREAERTLSQVNELSRAADVMVSATRREGGNDEQNQTLVLTTAQHTRWLARHICNNQQAHILALQEQLSRQIDKLHERFEKSVDTMSTSLLKKRTSSPASSSSPR